MTKSAKIITTTAVIASLVAPGAFLQYNVNQKIQSTLYGPPSPVIEEEIEKKEENTYVTEETTETNKNSNIRVEEKENDENFETEYDPIENMNPMVYGPPKNK